MAYFSATGTGGGSGGNEPVLLWTNPNPTSAFAAQTIELDLSEYSWLGFKVENLINSQQYGHEFKVALPITTDIILDISSNNRNYSSNMGPSGLTNRELKIVSNGIQFGSGAHDGSNNNSYCVPLNIYGIKSNVI